MANFQVVPMNVPPGSDDYLPCDESAATHWAVLVDENTRIVHGTREDAEEDAARLRSREQNECGGSKQ